MKNSTVSWCRINWEPLLPSRMPTKALYGIGVSGLAQLEGVGSKLSERTVLGVLGCDAPVGSPVLVELTVALTQIHRNGSRILANPSVTAAGWSRNAKACLRMPQRDLWSKPILNDLKSRTKWICLCSLSRKKFEVAYTKSIHAYEAPAVESCRVQCWWSRGTQAEPRKRPAFLSERVGCRSRRCYETPTLGTRARRHAAAVTVQIVLVTEE